MSEVEAHPLVVFVGTGLMHMAAQHLAQRLLQQMGAGVVAGDGAPAALGHAGGGGLAHDGGALGQGAGVDEVALRGLLDSLDPVSYTHL